MLPAKFDNSDPLAERFRQFIARPKFPCVGAKAALARKQLQFVVARDIASAWDDLRIYPALLNFTQTYCARKRLFLSFVVIFQNPRTLSEADFERYLWERLQSWTDKDAWHGQRHDITVSADPQNSRFGLSFGGEAFFAVGLHPTASRPARRFAYPTVVLNLHEQFEELRRHGQYDGMREKILERDRQLAGSVNPMLHRFGEESEAKQYSGRFVGNEWRCPFHRPPIDRLAKLLADS